MVKTDYLGVRIEPGVREVLEESIVPPDGTVSDVIRNILRDWAKKKKKNGSK